MKLIRRDRGIALFAVIWLGLLISAVAVGFTRDSRTALTIAQNETDALQARMAARSGIVWAGLLLGAQETGQPLQGGASVARSAGMAPLDPARRLFVDGRPHVWRDGAATVTLRLVAEVGKIDLNRGDPDVMALLFHRLGIANAGLVADGVVALREEDGIQRGISWRLNDRGFRSLNDLSRIPSLSPSDIRRLRPFVTVHGERDAPDPRTAPARLFAALPLDDDARAAWAAERERPAPRRDETLWVTITAHAELESGAAATEEALVRLSPTDRPAMRVIDWRGPG